ncbi:hypothetical protein L484_003163 [Morus notabilis]|uniref:DUF7806 domain-containing protein n=1 Tax=Morus notabilis TaxID=981085 RepID=W9RRG0_9ROSA|nr:hypothetical protein L484_003163 [Morus notabilis]
MPEIFVDHNHQWFLTLENVGEISLTQSRFLSVWQSATNYPRTTRSSLDADALRAPLAMGSITSNLIRGVCISVTIFITIRSLSLRVPISCHHMESDPVPRVSTRFGTRTPMEPPKMEVLYSKLYDKYTQLKAKRLTELDEVNKDQEVKFVNYVADKVLLEEVERLKKLQQDNALSSQKDGNNREMSTPRDDKIVSQELYDSSSGTMTSKRRRCSETETGMARPCGSGQDNAILIASASLNKEGLTSSAHVSIQQPECCRRAIDRTSDGLHDNDTANCLFQALVEYLVGLKFSVVTQNEGICISAEHQSSGYSFSLTWVEKEHGKEVELLYHVLSLGTLERIAPQWMKEAIMFSTTMCPIFFERVSCVVKLFS